MKTTLFLILTVILLSCEGTHTTKNPKEYSFQVQFFYQGLPSTQLDTIKWIGTGTNTFFLNHGDIVKWGNGGPNVTLLSGVTWFKVISIRDLKTNQQLEIK